MNTAVKEEVKSSPIAILEPSSIALAYQTQGGLQALFDKIKAEATREVFDVTTAEGRKAIASQAYKISRAKTLVDDYGKELVSAEKARLKLVDDERKVWRENCDACRDEIRKPLDDHENAEKERIANLEKRLSNLEAVDKVEYQTSADVKTAMTMVEGTVLDDSWRELLAKAAMAKDHTLYLLRIKLGELERQEDQAAELERLRIESAAREQADRERKIAEDAAEKARLKAEEEKLAAQREAEHAKKAVEAEQARRQAEAEAAQLRAEAAERRAEDEKKAALAKAEKDKETAVNAERERAAAAAREKQAEDEKRAADELHVRRIKGGIMKALIEHGLERDVAIAVIKSIADGAIPHLSIKY